MKFLNIYFSILFCFFANSIHAQSDVHNTYLDALRLAKLYRQNEGTEYSNNEKIYTAYYSILNQYAIEKNGQNTNPFLRDMDIPLKRKDTNIIKTELTRGIGGARGQVKVLNNYSYDTKVAQLETISVEKRSPEPISWEGAAVNGISNFLAGRFRQEILHLAINKTFANLKSKDTAFLKNFFPKTIRSIINLYGDGNNAYYTADFIQLKQIIRADIEDIPDNLVNHSDQLIPNEFQNKNQVKDILALSSLFMRNIRDGYSLDNLIHTLPNDLIEKFNCSNESNVYRIIELADVLSQAMLNEKNKESHWINSAQYKTNGKMDELSLESRYFYALLYTQLMKNQDLSSYIGVEHVPIDSSLLRMQKLLTFGNHLNRIHFYLKANGFKLNNIKDFNTYLEYYYKALGSFTEILYQSQNPNLIKKYTLPPKVITFCYKYFAVLNAINSKEFQSVIPIVIFEFGDHFGQSKKTLRTLNFISEMGSISSADEMEQLLKVYTLPIGSASIKRHSYLNVSINGYVGVTGGAESVIGSQVELASPNIGLAAPIGLSCTFDRRWTVFGSIIDLGTLVNQRLNNDNTSFSNLKFQHFFAPGLGLYYNIPKLSPITIGIHTNYIPSLKSIQYSNGTANVIESDRNVIRTNLSILIDIPFFTIHNEER